MTAPSICVPCATAHLPPASSEHRCSDRWANVDGLGCMSVTLCQCPACWPNGRTRPDVSGAGGNR